MTVNNSTRGKYVSTSVQILPALLEEIDAVTQETGGTRSAIIRIAISRYLRGIEMAKKTYVENVVRVKGNERPINPPLPHPEQRVPDQKRNEAEEVPYGMPAIKQFKGGKKG